MTGTNCTYFQYIYAIQVSVLKHWNNVFSAIPFWWKTYFWIRADFDGRKSIYDGPELTWVGFFSISLFVHFILLWFIFLFFSFFNFFKFFFNSVILFLLILYSLLFSSFLNAFFVLPFTFFFFFTFLFHFVFWNRTKWKPRGRGLTQHLNETMMTKNWQTHAQEQSITLSDAKHSRISLVQHERPWSNYYFS